MIISSNSISRVGVTFSRKVALLGFAGQSATPGN